MENVKPIKFLAPRIKSSVHDMRSIAHQGRLENVATSAHLFEEGCVEMKGRVFSLVIERNHLNAKGPEQNWIEVGRIDPHSSRIGTQQLRFSVVQDGCWLLSTQFLGRRLVNRATFKHWMTPLARHA